jgi:hypothetical protein
MNNENVQLNDVVYFYMTQYGMQYTVDHYEEIRESYYDQH